MVLVRPDGALEYVVILFERGVKRYIVGAFLTALAALPSPNERIDFLGKFCVPPSRQISEVTIAIK